ncbi:MAG: hypothetical protein IT335_14655, partial [Thermomicrobiales bacterium]|nr:hypothetical protein [Thermomicrobiales bacterium]
WLLAAGAIVAAIAVYTNVRSVLPLAAILVGCGLAALIENPTARSARTTGKRSIAIVLLTFLLVAPLAGALMRFGDLYVFVRYSSYADLGEYWRSSLQAVSTPVMVLAVVGALAAVLRREDDGGRTVLIVLALYVAGTASTVLSTSAANLVSQLEATRLMPFQRLLVIYLAAYGLWSTVDVLLTPLRHPERGEGSPATAVSGETTVVAGDDGEILRFAQDDGAFSRRAGAGPGTFVQDDNGSDRIPESRLVFADAVMAVTALLFLAGYVGAWLPGIPESDRAADGLVTTATAAIAELETQVRLADETAPPGTAILVLGTAVSWHDQLWSPQWSDRRFFYDDWLWYWQTDHYGAYDPETSHAYDDDASALDAAYLQQHGIGAVIVTGEAAPAAAASDLLTLERAGLWSLYLVNDPVTIATTDEDQQLDVIANDRQIAGSTASPADTFTVRHNWYPRWKATIDGHAASIEKDERGYMVVTGDDPGTEVVLTYRTDVWDWLSRLALVGGLLGVVWLLVPRRWLLSSRRFSPTDSESTPSPESARR